MVPEALQDVGTELNGLRAEMLAVEQRLHSLLLQIPEARRPSARNLLHYLALRHHDLRTLQGHLASMGLSSLGRAESQALANVQAVLDLVHRLGDGAGADRPCGPECLVLDGKARLETTTRALFGPAPQDRDVRIMVTLPAEAACDFGLVRDLVASGTDCVRINTAHDDATAWERMVRHVARASEITGRGCKVLMDLAGPKLRTGPMEPGPPVIRWRPERDVCGRVVRPARVWLTSREHPSAPPDRAAAVVPVTGAWLTELTTGDRIRLFDARDARRELLVVSRHDGGVWAESQQTAYVMPGTALRLRRRTTGRRHATVGDLPPTAQWITLKPDDTLVLARGAAQGRPAVLGDQGDVLDPAVIGVTLPDIFDDVRAGEAVWFDDGRIGGVIRTAGPERIEVAITQARPDGSRLGGDKGINLPDSDLRLPSLTPKDLEDLRFIAAHADIVGYSFVRTEGDVRELQSHLAALGRPDMPLVLKIETRLGFEQLPALLLAAMRSPAAGVMIARGDLAVECGYERMAEVQEEILWMAEASHMPVIWATQVLESLARDGTPSRAEITDAAMGERAECVMLNKGPYIVGAVRALENILRRMQTHQKKKSAMLRHLGVADRFLDAH